MSKEEIIAELDILVRRGENIQDGLDQMSVQLAKIGDAITELRKQL